MHYYVLRQDTHGTHRDGNGRGASNRDGHSWKSYKVVEDELL